MSAGLTAVTVAAALGSGLLAGVFFAFSTFVMQGLRRLEPREGILAMQAINVAAPRSPLVPAMVVAALLGVVAAAGSLIGGDGEGPLLLAAAVLYVGGVIVVTGVANIPRNNALAALDPGEPEAPAEWRLYLHEWTAWNHVRTVAPLLAAGLQIAALL